MRFGEGRFVKHIDYRIIIAALAIVGIGFVLLSSIPEGRGKVVRQALYVGLGLGFLVAAVYVDYEFLRRHYALVYSANVAVLVLVLLVGRVTHGMSGWIPLGPITIQPSEFSKLAVIGTLAAYMSNRRHRIREAGPFVLSFVEVAAVPVLLILLQPDLGTALVCVAIWVAIVFVAGCRRSHLGLTLFGGLVFVGVLWKYGLLPREPMSRITGWLYPWDDPQGDGYHYIASQATVGSGGWFGHGFLSGPMTQNEQVPEQHTDMVFSALGEEWGLIGCTVLLALYLFIIWRGMATMSEAKNPLGQYVAAGVTGMLLCHVVVNIGMQIRLAPITGIPLPLVSAGGSSLIACMGAIGLLVNVHMRRKKLTF